MISKEGGQAICFRVHKRLDTIETRLLCNWYVGLCDELCTL